MIKIFAPLVIIALFSACSVSDSSTEPTISEVPSFFGTFHVDFESEPQNQQNLSTRTESSQQRALREGR